MREKNARIVCLVPSWTETLLEADLNVIGRTRFCLYPVAKIGAVNIIGGTKNIKIDKIIALNPDFVILDREENKKETAMALEQAGIEILVSNVLNLESTADFLELLGKKFSSSRLVEYAQSYRMILTNKKKISKEKFISKIILQQKSEIDFSKIEYVIWKNPFMVIGAGTFISEVFKLIGIELVRNEKYPVVSAEDLMRRYSFFSSEPYPFAKDYENLIAAGFQGVVVDGEKISWYGIRNLRFLESCLM